MRTRRHPWIVLAALAAAVSLAAAACGDDGGGDSSSDDSTTTDTGGGGSGRTVGVTDDTIRIAYSYLDFEFLVEQDLSANGWGDQELAFQTFVDDINENGGINGRQLEASYEAYSPVGVEDAEAACLRFTEDNPVFAVVGGFLGPAEPANVCIAGRGGTVLVGGVQSEERLAEATAPWITDRVLRTDQAEILLTLLDEQGDLEDAEVALVTNIDAQDTREDVVGTMSDFGVEPVEDLVIDAPIGDVVAEDAAWGPLAERIQASGANTILVVGNPSSTVRNAASHGLDVQLWVVDQESLQNLGATLDIEDARGAITSAPLAGQELWDDPTVAECREIFESANPDIEIIEPDDLVEGDEDWPQGIVSACRFFKLFQAVADEAGDDLSQESFEAAVASIGDFEIPGQPFASLSADKLQSNDSFQLVEFNPDIGQDGGFDPLTEVEDVTP